MNNRTKCIEIYFDLKIYKVFTYLKICSITNQYSSTSDILKNQNEKYKKLDKILSTKKIQKFHYYDTCFTSN